MKKQKLFLISAVTFLIFTCIFAQTPVFASDSPADQTIDVEETDVNVIVDDNFVIVEEGDFNYDNDIDNEIDEEMDEEVNEKVYDEIDEQIEEQEDSQE